ncbi:MAG: hypothetical protein KC466_20275, partial [Myxococcales bacterium]|nr:hypothetical protein [Myxococcales bacterium]
MLFALHPYHALAGAAPAYGVARLPGVLLAAMVLWQAARARRPEARPMGILTAALAAALCAWDSRFWPLGLLPATLELLDRRPGDGARALYRALPSALVALVAWGPWRAGAPTASLRDLADLARLAVSPLGNLTAAELPRPGGLAPSNWLFGEATAAADAVAAVAALAALTLVALRREVHPKALVFVALLAVALGLPGGPDGEATWRVAVDPRHQGLALPVVLAWSYALTATGAARGIRAFAVALALLVAAGWGTIAHRSAEAAADVARASDRFVEDFDRWARPRLRPDGVYVFAGVPADDRGLVLATPRTLAAAFGLRVPGLERADWRVLAPGDGAPFADLDPRAVDWGER